MSELTQPIKWHGGKHYLAKWIISLMPPRCKNPNKPDPADPGWLHYVEPYFGGGAVLLAQDPEGIGEVVNDLNGDLATFWGVLMDPVLFADFQRRCEGTPPSEAFFARACDLLEDRSIPRTPVEYAWAFFVKNRQSRQGLMKDFATLTRNRTRRGMNEQASAWLSAVDGLPEVHARLKRVVILNRDALDVIRQQDGPRTLFYLDPPYLHETRTAKAAYEHEMTASQHKELLHAIRECQGKVMLSGYRSQLYDEMLSCPGRWTRHEKLIDNKSSSSAEKELKTECVWTNF